MSQIISECKLELPNPIHFKDNIDYELPRLIGILNENTTCSNFSAIVKFLFGHESVFNHVSLEELEEKLLKPTLYPLQKIFSSNLNNILQILENSDDFREDVYFSLSEILQVCLDILSGYYDIVDQLQNVSSLLPKNVESLLKTLPGILLEAFTHCQESESNYGLYFSKASELLTTFFRKSYDISSLLYKVLDEQITFNCLVEKDVCLLVTVLEILCSIGDIVVSLDIKTLVEQWKGIAKLLTKYAPNLKDRLNISQPMKFLIDCLEKSISAITEDQEDGKSRNRNLKLGSFILKIIVKLCEMYNGYLDTCIYNLFKLLLLLNRCSRWSEKNYNEELERFIVVGAGPLLSHLARDRQFIEVFEKSVENGDQLSPEEIIGFFYTHLRLFKFLINSTDPGVKDYWLKIPLVESVIKLFSKSCKNIDLTIRIDDNDTYATLVSVTVAFVVSNFGNDHFLLFEQFLFFQLFNDDVEVGILVSDLLTLLCRLTNEEVCLRQTRYLYLILSQLDAYSFRPEISIARVTAARMYSLLSRTGQELIERSFPYSMHVWRHTQFASPEKFATVDFTVKTSNVTSPKELVDKVEDLYMRCRSIKFCESLLNESLIDTYRRVFTGLMSCCEQSDHQPDWWCNLFFLLVKCFQHLAVYLEDDTFEQVYATFSKLLTIGQSSAIYYISNALGELCSEKLSSSLSRNFLNKVSSLFKLCLLAKNVLIKQIALERFISIDKKILPDFLNHMDEEIQKNVLDYSRKIISKSSNTFSYDISFTHKCFIFNYENINLPPNKKFKSDTDVIPISSKLQKLKEDVEKYATFVNRNPLSTKEREIVHKIICTLENL